MGGGVGVGGNASHRIVGATTAGRHARNRHRHDPRCRRKLAAGPCAGPRGRISGPDRRPHGTGDAIWAGFADTYIPETEWPALIDRLARNRRRRCDPATPSRPACRVDLFGLCRRYRRRYHGRAGGHGRRDQPETPAPRLAPVDGRDAGWCARPAKDASIRDSLAREMRFTARTTESGRFSRRRARPDHRQGPQSAMARRCQPAHVAAMLASLGHGEITWRTRNEDRLYHLAIWVADGGQSGARGHEVAGFDLAAPMPRA